MRETDFIRQNRLKWKELEELNKHKSKDPEKLSRLFVEVTNDLSYSKSYYPNRSIKVYLNNLALGIHSVVYRNKIAALSSFVRFWSHDLPRAAYETRKELLLSFIVFAAGLIIGMFSSAEDQEFCRHILGDDYVDMTIRNIEMGEPTGVYKYDSYGNIEPPGPMFLSITKNNILVSFLAFSLGALFGIGTIGVLLYNGISIGAFFYLFISRDLTGEAFLAIFTHGTPELSAIVLAGAAGLVLAKGVLFPGTYSRSDSFLIAARRAVMFMIVIIPMLVLAGYLESYVTRQTEVDDWKRLLRICIMAVIILSYFVVRPLRKFGFGKNKADDTEYVPNAAIHDYRLRRDKQNAAVYTDVFALYRESIFHLIPRLFALALIYGLSMYFLIDRAAQEDIFSSVYAFNSNRMFGIDYFFELCWMSFVKVDLLFNYANYFSLFIMNGLFFTVALLLILRQVERLFCQTRGIKQQSLKHFAIKQSPWIALSIAVSSLTFFIEMPLSLVVMILVFPLGLRLLVSKLSTNYLRMSVSDGFKYMFASYGRSLGLFCITLLTAVLFIMIINTGIVDMILGYVMTNIKMEEQTHYDIVRAVQATITMLSLALVAPLFVYGSCLGFLTAYERKEAKGLKEDIEKIGTTSRAYGLVKE